ncbi:hypothetical protein CerSpe_065990 [Prunus speciosa]
MDDGEVGTSDQAVDTFVDECLKNTQTCTHTHTCNPPGPDAAHTHTCYHTHTQVLPSEDNDGAKNKEHSFPRPRRRRPSRNREAVRKYREKKKAHTAYLEEEVKKLRLLNQQLVRKIQGQAILETEFLRLRSVFLDLRGKIDHELGAFPFQNQCKTSSVLTEGDCNPQLLLGQLDFVVKQIYHASVHLLGHQCRLVSAQARKQWCH